MDFLRTWTIFDLMNIRERVYFYAAQILSILMLTKNAVNILEGKKVGLSVPP